ncbi:MAG TPA: cytochrome c oxidase assembly protein [Thermoleophilaceae bacterium]|jgi:cytochrome c oxidase assembly factor CtaG
MPSPLAPPFLLGVLVALLYVRGRRRHMRVVAPGHRAGLGWRAVAFWSGLVTLVLALDSVIDDEADRLFWVHMVQHALLMMVAAPLLVLAAPWIPIWKGLPLSTRRGLGAAYMRSPGWRAARAVGRRLAAPVAVWVLFSLDLAVWHVPVLYGATLRHQWIHDLEHVSFLVLAVLFWAQVIESPPLKARLPEAWRVAYVTLEATVCWVLAMVLAFAPSPLYSGYSELGSRPGGLSALADQQLAAGIMWGPGSIPFAIFVFVALYRWLGGRSTEPPWPQSGVRDATADPPRRAAVGSLAPRS